VKLKKKHPILNNNKINNEDNATKNSFGWSRKFG
jgi:hypothetical protein